MIFPKQWYLYLVHLEPRIGTKPGKTRPCLVVQPSEFSLSGLKSSVIIPLTSKTIQENAFPLRIRIPSGIAGLDKDSDLLIDQILAWDNSLFAEELGPLPEYFIDQARNALRNFLDL